MTESEIKVFLKVAECGSISTAAKELYLTQPTVSLKIKSMEEQLGAVLFNRNRGQRNTDLTAEGSGAHVQKQSQASGSGLARKDVRIKAFLISRNIHETRKGA